MVGSEFVGEVLEATVAMMKKLHFPKPAMAIGVTSAILPTAGMPLAPVDADGNLFAPQVVMIRRRRRRVVIC